MEDLQLSAKVNLTGNIRKRRKKCGGKSLAAHVILWHPSRPTISKQEAITISSTFTARPLSLSLLFMSSFFFVLFFLLHFSFSFYFHQSSLSLSSSLLPSVDSGGGCINSSASVCADECWFEWRIQPHCVRFCMHVRLPQVCVCVSASVCWCLCATSGRPDAPPWQRRRVWRPAAPLLWDNGGCIIRFSQYRSPSLSFSLTHLLPISFLSHTHTHTHTHTYTCILSLPSLSERLHSPPYRLKPALTVLAPLTHTLPRGHTTLWNNYSLNWQLINLKSIWPCRPNLEIESRGSRDTEAKNWVDGGTEGAEEEAGMDAGKW